MTPCALRMPHLCQHMVHVRHHAARVAQLAASGADPTREQRGICLVLRCRSYVGRCNVGRWSETGMLTPQLPHAACGIIHTRAVTVGSSAIQQHKFKNIKCLSHIYRLGGLSPAQHALALCQQLLLLCLLCLLICMRLQRLLLLPLLLLC